MYDYEVTEVVKITDGDTYWLRLDVGFRQSLLAHIRLAGYDTPEKNRGTRRERDAAIAAQVEASDFIAEGLYAAQRSDVRLMVHTEKDPDNFGRWLGAVYIEHADGTRIYLGAVLQAKGLATEWPTRWRDTYDAER